VVSETPVAPSSAGRSDLALRVFAAALFMPCAYLITAHGGIQFVFLVDVVVFTGMLEFYRMIEAQGLRPSHRIGVLCGLALTWYAYFRGGMYLNFALAGVLLILMTVELTRRRVDQAVLHICSTIFGVLYVGWLASHLILLRELPAMVGLDYEMGARFVFLAVVYTWACDTGAYFVGRAIGRHPLFPRVSPKKTWEGAIGGVFFSALAGFVAQRTFASYLDLPVAIILGVVAAVAGITGDLVESLMKRDSHVKDSATIIPGHGGTLDRFDSLFFVVPLIYYFHKFFVL
jgi:phosphatidate cytidylyltransferase